MASLWKIKNLSENGQEKIELIIVSLNFQFSIRKYTLICLYIKNLL